MTVYDSLGNVIVAGLTVGLAIKTMDYVSKELKPRKSKPFKKSKAFTW